MNSIVSSLLICSLLAFISINAQSTSSNINVQLFAGSNSYWIAIAVQNANVATTSVQAKDTGSSSWSSMELSADWGYWTLTSPTGVPFKFPISFSLTSVTGTQITTSIPALTSGTVNTGVQYAAAAASTSVKVSATTAPVTATTVPVKATTAPVKATTAPVKATAAPVKATSAPVQATAAPVKATTAPVSATAKPASGSASTATGCSAPIKLMVPLYTYPDAGWTAVAAGASLVPTVAIINPNSGPGNGPDSAYVTGMETLSKAGVEIVGYVHTSYGARAMADVKADIAQYAAEFPLVSGIFIDEAAATDDQLAYYTEIYNYIMSFPGWKYDIINPGMVTTAGYVGASTQIVAFEQAVTKFSASSNPSYASCASKDHYAMISYGATKSLMQSAISAAKSKSYYGWVYVTDGPAGGTTYNVLTSYYAAQASYIAASINI